MSAPDKAQGPKFAMRDPEGMLSSRIFRPTPRGEVAEIEAHGGIETRGGEKSEQRWHSKAHASVAELRQQHSRRADEIETAARALAGALGRDRCHYRRGSRF